MPNKISPYYANVGYNYNNIMALIYPCETKYMLESRLRQTRIADHKSISDKFTESEFYVYNIMMYAVLCLSGVISIVYNYVNIIRKIIDYESAGLTVHPPPPE